MDKGLRDGFAASMQPADAALSLPPVAYHDGAVQALEREAVFGRGWVPIGRADRVKAAGDYEALEIGGRPIILLRDKAGALRALANSCRHRGARGFGPSLPP